MVDLLCCTHEQPAHFETSVNQHPQIFFLKPLWAQQVPVLCIALTHVQNLVLGPVKRHETGTDAPLKPIYVPLDRILPPSMLNAPLIADSALYLKVHVTYKIYK